MQGKTVICVVIGVLAATTGLRAEQYPFDSDAWEMEAEEATLGDYLGERALFLKGGAAELKGVAMTDGVIEFDIAVTPSRGFVGGFFRKVDDSNYENFYIRPHQSGNPDANQYNPVFNGVASWQLYHGPGFGAPVDYRYDEWLHIKIVFSKMLADIYVDSETPTIRVRDLKRPLASGAVGINASNFAPAHFANFEVTGLPDDYRFDEVAIEPPPPEIVNSWLVSDAFDGAVLEGVHRLGTKRKSGREWTTLAAGPGGIANLARIQGLAEGRDTAFARLVIDSDTEQLKGLNFGYSDAVAVYVNGILIYSGSNLYRSRDYRYLGTIGLFDKVYLPLEAGENEIWFAVTEAFGGWGIQAQFDDLQGIELRQHP